MGNQLSAEDKELFRGVDEVLHYVWDPIGVAGTPESRDEYDSYAPHVFSMLQDSPSAEIAQFLVTTEAETMGLAGSECVQERAEEVVEILKAWRDFIRDRPPII